MIINFISNCSYHHNYLSRLTQSLISQQLSTALNTSQQLNSSHLSANRLNTAQPAQPAQRPTNSAMASVADKDWESKTYFYYNILSRIT